MYKQIKEDLEDKKILEEDIQGLKERIKYKIQNELGLHATTFSELKVECPKVEDRFLRTFEKIERLDKKRETLQGELDIIEKTIENIDSLLSKMEDKKKKVFRCRYIWGLSVKTTAERLHYSEDYVKEITKKIWKN